MEEKLYFKITNPDGTSFHDKKTKYEVGKTVRKRECSNPELCTSDVLHASREVLDALSFARIPCKIFRVAGTPVVEENRKAGFFSLKVIEEIPESEYDELLGFAYHEAVNPIQPADITPPQINDDVIELVRQWDSVYEVAGNSVWNSIRDSVWKSVWDSVWQSVWNSILDSVGNLAWYSVMDSVWNAAWGYVGSLFPNVEPEEYVKHKNGEYPFEPAAKLWRLGLIPVRQDGKWHLYHPTHPIIATLVWEE